MNGSDRATGNPTGAVIADLLRSAQMMRPSVITELIASHAARLGLRDAGLWVVDVQQRTLLPFGKDPNPEEEGLPVDTTLAGRAYRDCSVQHGEAAGDTPAITTWVPLFDGSRRLGVLGGRADHWNEGWVEDLTIFGSTVAIILTSQESYTDDILRTRRLRAPTLATEIQWALLPPLSFSSDRTNICGALEPAYDIGGDSFDYAVNGDVAHLGVFDAMGHGLRATLLSSVAVGAYRHTRREGGSVQDSYREIDRAINDEFGGDRFVTGMLAELNLDSGEISYLAAGHDPGLVLRHGRVVRSLDAARRLPFGLATGLGRLPAELTSENIGQESLEPGDRILLYTDGVVEGRDSNHEFFGLNRLEELFVRADASSMPAQETLRRLVHAVLAHQGGRLQDDATLLLLEWHGG